MESLKKVVILGLGNLLLKDEGMGVHVVERLKNMELPHHVEVIDGGTLGIDLLYYIENREKVIVIDAVKADEPPGTLYRFSDRDIEDKKNLLHTAHQIDFIDALKIAHFLGNKPEVVFIGIEPEDIGEGLELSPTIEEKILQIIELVMKEIGS